MIRTKLPGYFLLLSAPLLLELVITSGSLTTAQAQAKTPTQTSPLARLKQVTFEPRKDQPAPTTTVGGGRRNDGRCSQDRISSAQSTLEVKSLDQLLTPLLRSPVTDPQLTVSPRPTFLVYVPQTSATAMELTLERDGKGIYQTTVNLIGTPGIVSIQLPANAPELEMGKDYKWLVSMVCGSGAPEDSFVEGSVRRVQPNSTLSQIEQAKPLDKVALYAKNGVWFDTVAALAALRKAQPNDPQVASAWENLLKDAGLGAIAKAPLKN
ncbi:DUF928 domain-containing protein [Allocoleopsis franciscana]|uniref:DUF928 domain-containing protein n=1 Tax=Allocoleopsis franciscana PCC 7113 TaxID=1173027 RepID=K9WND4_9CYAN|nr:DUF928 domain-containing protein [Allocoleopsis franciscana]AFZ21688.1 protein of unknown function (DUF928) [Allocoleopsis franciscana PCC 7113]